MWKQWKLKHMCMITFTNQVELSFQRERTRLSGNVNSSQKHTRVTSTWQRKVSPCFTTNRFRRRWIGNFLTTWNFTSLDFLQICKFPLNQSEIPGLPRSWRNFIFLIFSLTCGNHGIPIARVFWRHGNCKSMFVWIIYQDRKKFILFFTTCSLGEG